jgi:opacity protein-like surface antigen
MKKLILCLMITVILFSAASTAIAAVETSGDAYAGVYSKYVWRGFDLSQNDTVVIQGGADVSISDFTFSWWGNFSESTGELNEVDFVLDYSRDLGETVSLSIGNIVYDVDGVDTTNEVYLGLGLNVPLSPTATVYYDYDEFDAVYTTIGISHDIEAGKDLAVSLGATGSYMFDSQSWLHNLELSAGADYAINDLVSVGVCGLYSAPLTERARRNTGIREEYTAGATVTLAF